MSTEPSQNEIDAHNERMIDVAVAATKGVRGFAAEMREKGIHVGLGATPRCVTCGQPWPCDGGESR